MSFLALGLLCGTIGFIYFNNQAHCADENSCIETTLEHTGSIVSYNEIELQSALERGDKLAFYFEAARCSNCKHLKDELLSKGIPENTTMFLVDFDKAKQLRIKYQVNNLHTVILTDQNLNLISRDES